MNKKQNYSAILAGIAVTAILVASSIIAGNQFTQQAHAQANATSSTPSTPRSAGTQQQVRVGQLAGNSFFYTQPISWTY
jgi:hypothetical protein